MSKNEKEAKDDGIISSQKQQQLKKYAIFAGMALVFALCLWFIFAPSESEKQKELDSVGINTEVPMPSEIDIVGDKRTAYEQQNIAVMRQEKMRTLQDFGAILGDGETIISDTTNSNLQTDPIIARKAGKENAEAKNSINSSLAAYNDINKTLGSFYEQPKVDKEKEAMAKELAQLKARGDGDRESRVNEQMAIMEKSYQLASQYMPGAQVPAAAEEPKPGRSRTNKMPAVSTGKIKEATVSALPSNLAVNEGAQSRNTGFHGLGSASNVDKNTISACVYNDQTLTDGQGVRLRLLEPIMVGEVVVPRNSIVTGIGKIEGERLDITITSMEVEGNIVHVDFTVYDTDGQQGIYIPNSMEINAAKEVVSNMGGSAGTSISLTGSPSQQLAADAGKGIIQGASKYISKKMQEVKINLKTGYKLMLLPKE